MRRKPKKLTEFAPVVERPVSKHWVAYLSFFNVGLVENAHMYAFGNMDALVSHSNQAGWFLHVKVKSRMPTWEELLLARARFVPLTAAMALIMPPSDQAGKNAIQLWEIDRPPHKVHVGPQGEPLGYEIN